MEGISKNVKQTPESVKSTSEVRKRQNKINTLKFVNRVSAFQDYTSAMMSALNNPWKP